MNRNGSNSISCSFDAFKRDRAGEVGCLRQMKMAATVSLFLFLGSAIHAKRTGDSL